MTSDTGSRAIAGAVVVVEQQQALWWWIGVVAGAVLVDASKLETAEGLIEGLVVAAEDKIRMELQTHCGY